MAVSESPVSAPPVVPKKASRSKRIALGCGGAAIVLALLVGVVSIVVRKATAGPEAVVHEFLTAAAAGDYPRAHSFFAAPLQQVQPLSEFKAKASANSSLFSVKDTTFNERSIDTGGARLSGSVTLSSGTQMPASFQLVHENGAWKLLAYNIGGAGVH